MIVVTGSESFVGKELIKQCKTKGLSVVGLDVTNESTLDYEFHRIDIRSGEVVDLIPENSDAIIHLAALSRDQDCNGKGYECFDINVMGTMNLMKAAQLKNVKQFVFASSEWVYDKFVDGEEKDEESLIDIANHKSEYALSKLVSESNLRQQYQNGFCNVTVLRFGIIYGPRTNNWSAVESIVSSVKNKNEVTVGSLKTGRRFVHVKDIVRGILLSLGLEGFHTINLSANKVITLGEIIEKSQKILNKTIKITESSPNQPNIRNPSNKKAKNILHWQPEIDLENGLKSIISYV